MDSVYCKKSYELRLRKKGVIVIFDKGCIYKMERVKDEYRIYIDDEKFLNVKGIERFNTYFKLISQHRNELINKILSP
jgi:hypothetical protein